MTQDNSTKFRPLPVILMVLILATMAAGGWWLKNRPASPVLNTAGTSPTLLPSAPMPKKVQYSLFIPNDNAMLEKHIVEVSFENPPNFTELAASAITQLMEKSPETFPSGTKLLKVKTNGDGTAIVDFNSRFIDSNFWHGSARTVMTTYSIINTITALPAKDFNAQKVRFYVEGKPVAVLGQMDVNEPLEPDMQWVQPS